MQKTIIKKAETLLIGLSARTNNKAEMDTSTAQIGATMHRFFSHENRSAIFDDVNNIGEAGIFYSVYTNYESDASGDYTYFIGHKVSNFDNVPEGLETLTIPAQTYVKFTSDAGKMPDVCINLWQKIWAMDDSTLGGKRAFIADYELYDARAANPESAILDIFIGIQ